MELQDYLKENVKKDPDGLFLISSEEQLNMNLLEEFENKFNCLIHEGYGC